MIKATAKDVSEIRSFIPGRKWKQMEITPEQVRHYAALDGVGINFSDRALSEMIQFAMDGNDVGIAPSPLPGLSPYSITTPVQFLQNWLPGLVKYLTAPRKMDELVGLSTVGSWEDEQIVQAVMEPLGTAFPYGDYTNVPLVSWNLTFEVRTVVRFEAGMLVGTLEEARAARVRVNSGGEKRFLCADALEVQRNRVAFYGYNDGSGRTFGFLNDPTLPAYVTFPNGASGNPLWSGKTFLEITADIRLMLAALQTQSLGRIDPKKTPITIALPVSVDQFLTITTTLGSYSVAMWLADTYKNVRLETAPELNDANGGASAVYAYADSVDAMGSTDGGQTIMQVATTKFNALGVEKRAKSYLEDYSNGVGGVMVKRPWAVVRYTGA